MKLYCYALKIFNYGSAPDSWVPMATTCQGIESPEVLLMETRYIDFAIPTNFNPAQREVAALQKAIVEARRSAEILCTNYETRINNLLAIEGPSNV